MDPGSSPLDSIRRSDVSRRGGVRVRGGRLPPIRIRDSALIPTPSKKVIAPKIPQRRLKAKDETLNPYHVSQACDSRRSGASVDSRRQSSQGRGRGPKVYVQSEGTFLGEGPALKLKKDVQTSSYERGPRGSRSKTGDVKFDPARLKYLFEDYDEDVQYEDSLVIPVRFPILKKEVKQEIKQEIKEEIKMEIKEEINFQDMNVEDVKRFIKKEPVDSDSEDNKIVEKFEKVDISEKLKSHPFEEDIKFIKGEDTFTLLQMPSFLPFKKAPGNSNQSIGVDKNPKNRNEDLEAVAPETDLRSLSEGHLGKFQILRSGEMRLVFGSVTMSMERTMTVPTVLEVVSIPKDGDMIVLGRVERKLILSPLVDKDIVENESKNGVY